MNYIAEIRAFYDWVESNPSVSTSCISLWHGLMFQANKAGWKSEFSVAISTLELRTGLKRGAIYRARNMLKQCGAIDFRERDGSQSAMYRVNSLCSFKEHNRDTNQNTIATQSRHKPEHKPVPLLNKTKLNSKDIKDIMSSEPVEQKKQRLDIPALYAELCPNLPQIRAVTDKRKAAISRLVKELPTEDIKSAFVVFNRSDFCLGVNDRGWRADFDFCIKPESITKALEGKYDARPTAISGTYHQLNRKETVNERNNRLLDEFFTGGEEVDRTGFKAIAEHSVD